MDTVSIAKSTRSPTGTLCPSSTNRHHRGAQPYCRHRLSNQGTSLTGKDPRGHQRPGFLQTDPIEGSGPNAYDYVGQDPINRTDLNGECWHVFFCGSKHHGAFDIKRRMAGVPYRYGRDRAKGSAWGDIYGNFGAAHATKGHVGAGKDWASESAMTHDIRNALTLGTWTPNPYNFGYVVTWVRTYGFIGHICGCQPYEVTVIVSTLTAPDGDILGIRTAWRNSV